MIINPVDMPQRGVRGVARSDSPRSAQMQFHAVMRADGGIGTARGAADMVADAAERRSEAGTDASQGADITTSEAEMRDEATGARPSRAIRPQVGVWQEADALADPSEGADARADPMVPEPQGSGQPRGGVAGSEAVIGQHMQPDAGQDLSSSRPLKPGRDSPMPADRPVAPEVVIAEGAGAIHPPTATHAELPDARSDAVSGRPTTALARNPAPMPHEAGAHPAAQARARKDVPVPGAIQTLPLTSAADPRNGAAMHLSAGPARDRRGPTDSSAALLAAHPDLLADAETEKSGHGGAQGLRASGGAMGSIIPAAAGSVSQGQTGMSSIAVLYASLQERLPDVRTDAGPGPGASRLLDPRSASSPETGVPSVGAANVAGSAATVSVLPGPLVSPAARDGANPARMTRSDRTDAALLPSPGHAPALAVLAQPGAPLREAGARSLRVQIIDGVRSSAQSAFEIQLAPSELGRLRITLRPGESGMQLFFAADRPETLEMIRRHASDLEQDLRALGYEALDLGFAQSDDRQPRTGKLQPGAAPVTSDMPAPLQGGIGPASPAGARGSVDLRL